MPRTSKARSERDEDVEDRVFSPFVSVGAAPCSWHREHSCSPPLTSRRGDIRPSRAGAWSKAWTRCAASSSSRCFAAPRLPRRAQLLLTFRIAQGHRSSPCRRWSPYPIPLRQLPAMRLARRQPNLLAAITRWPMIRRRSLRHHLYPCRQPKRFIVSLPSRHLYRLGVATRRLHSKSSSFREVGPCHTSDRFQGRRLRTLAHTALPKAAGKSRSKCS